MYIYSIVVSFLILIPFTYPRSNLTRNKEHDIPVIRGFNNQETVFHCDP